MMAIVFIIFHGQVKRKEADLKFGLTLYAYQFVIFYSVITSDFFYDFVAIPKQCE